MKYARGAMLKIVRSASSTEVTYALSGRIDQEHLEELQKAFDAEQMAITLDMREVTRVDRDTIATLARWNSKGIEFRNCPTYLRNWIAKAQDPKN
jgi:ABC-type transporter Mla MlaB component